MKRLSPIEHAKARGPIVSMSLPDHGPRARSETLAWLERRQSDGWFYAKGDNYAFGSQADANAFKQWLMSERV